MFCPYCGVDHEENIAVSDEHVIPYAIGGSNRLVIRVCAESNNGLGGLVDKPFIEMFLVHTKRFLLGLCGTDGTEPSLDLGGKSKIDGQERKISYAIDSNDSKQLRIAPNVARTVSDEGEHWAVSGDPEAVRSILEGKLRAAEAQGLKLTGPTGDVLTLGTLDKFLSEITPQKLRPEITKTVTVKGLDSVRFFAKLALAVGHFTMGETFSRSPFADVLRTAMAAKDIAEVSIPGAKIWPFISEPIPALEPFRRKDSHFVGVLGENPPIFIASLFGEFDAIIPLGPPDDAKAPCAPAHGRLLFVELPSRRVNDTSF